MLRCVELNANASAHPCPPACPPARPGLQGKKMVGEKALRSYLDKWDRKYWATYKVLDILQKVFYR